MIIRTTTKQQALAWVNEHECTSAEFTSAEQLRAHGFTPSAEVASLVLERDELRLNHARLQAQYEAVAKTMGDQVEARERASSPLVAAIARLTKERDEALAQVESWRIEIQDRGQERDEALTKVAELEGQVSALEHERNCYRGQMNTERRRVVTLEAAQSELTRAHEVEGLRLRLKEALDELESRRNQRTESRMACHDILKLLGEPSFLPDMGVKLPALVAARIAEHAVEVERLTGQRDTAERELNAFSERVTTLESELAASRERVAGLEAEFGDADRERLTEIADDILGLQPPDTASVELLNAIEARHTETCNALSKATNDLTASRAEVERLSTLLAVAEDKKRQLAGRLLDARSAVTGSAVPQGFLPPVRVQEQGEPPQSYTLGDPLVVMRNVPEPELSANPGEVPESPPAVRPILVGSTWARRRHRFTVHYVSTDFVDYKFEGEQFCHTRPRGQFLTRFTWVSDPPAADEKEND